jgi:hypothetical protein
MAILGVRISRILKYERQQAFISDIHEIVAHQIHSNTMAT